MPFRSTDSGYSQYSVQREEPRPAPGFSETVTSAFKMENDVLNAYERITAPDYLPDPEFDLGRNLKEKGLWELRDDYLGVRSAQEMDYRTNQIQEEQKNRQTLAEAGWGGVVASIAAGAASPITFVPLIGPGLKGAKAVAYSASLAAMSAGAQEGVLFTSQQTRTGEEAAFSVAASTILGGILGGAVGMMKRADFDELSSRMGTSNNDEAILEPVQGANAGAAFVVRDATGGLKSGAGNKLAFIGPVTRLHAQKASPTGKAFINEFADAGLKMENAVAAAPGGNIESMIKTYALYDVKGITSLDEEFADYTLTGPGIFRNLRADLASWSSRGKMNRAEFNEEVTKAGWSGDVHPDKFVQAAAQRLRKEVYDPILKEAQEVGLLPKDIDLKGDLSYISRMYDTRQIKARKNDFIDILSAHFEKKLADEFQERFVKFSEKTARDQELIGDLGRTREEADALRAQFEEELRSVDEEIPEHVRILSDDIAVLKQQLRQIPDIEERGTPTPGVKSPAELRAALRAEIAQLKEQGGEALSGFEKRTKEVKRRLKTLNQSRVVMEDRRAAKLERLERIDELSLSSLNRAVRASQRFLTLLNKTSDKALDAEISKLKTRFAQAAETYDRGEERIVKLREEGTDDLLFAADDLQTARGEKLTDLAQMLNKAEAFDRQAWKEAVDQLLNESLERVQNINLRRGARAQRLREGLEDVDPKLVDERIAKVAKRVKERGAGLADLYRDKGDDVDLESGTANFSSYARDLAEDTTNNILKMNSRIQFNDLIKEKRGPEVARMLDISSLQMAEFLEKNAEKNLRLYVKTMGSDISIMRRTGSTNAQKFFDDLLNEHNAKTAALKTAVDKEGNPLSKEKVEELQTRINKEYAQNLDDMTTVLERARRQRGVPDNPDGWAERGAALVMNLNTLRFMGGVTISSIPDIGRPIMKYGLTRVFRDGFGAMIRDLKTVRMSQREGLLAGVAGTDPVLHSRAFAFSEITDTYGRGTKLERAVQYATNKIGVLALFDYWTSAWKSFTSGLVNAEMLENISIVMEGGNAKQLAKANHYLASVNLSPDLIETVWQQVQKGGGAKINGVWLPQTERWDMADPQVRAAKRAYYAAMAKEVDDTIITPGFERPSVVDKNLPWKMLFQFKSFAMSSTTKTLMAGLQEDGFKAKFLTGTMVSLAFGALSYYLWAVATGGKAYTEMLNADIDKWADEAIARAGITGAGDLAHSFAQRIPGIQPYTSFSGTRSSRREAGDISEAILGPSFDFLEKTGGVLSGIDEPTQGTAKQFKSLIPLQNHFLLRQGFDAIIANSGLPEKRQ